MLVRNSAPFLVQRAAAHQALLSGRFSTSSTPLPDGPRMVRLETGWYETGRLDFLMWVCLKIG